ncbi:hypothetical protein E2I00_002284, partial [Balaenoptera physalus]
VEQTQDLPPSSPLKPPLQLQPPGHLLAILCFPQQLTPDVVLSSLLPINHELPDPPEFFHQVKAAITHLINLHLWASYTSLSLGFHSSCKSHSLGGKEGALALEETLNRVLLKLHALGSAHRHSHLFDFLEKHFLDK